MLDKQDLQAIKDLIDTSISASEERTHAEIRALGESTHIEFNSVRAEIKALDESTRSEINSVRAEIKALDESTRSEINSVRAEIRAAEDRWMTFYESAIQPQLQLLAEGQQTILETLAPKSRVEALEEEVVFLKSIVKNLAQDVAELKKAE